MPNNNEQYDTIPSPTTINGEDADTLNTDTKPNKTNNPKVKKV